MENQLLSDDLTERNETPNTGIGDSTASKEIRSPEDKGSVLIRID